ncbi:MAG TPA: helix-turn-helix domain-containing protein [Acidobacteriaceae bacterium]|nr:helix-turn-helix domain-containing protein [Acidobacteriaceae bacterium]
MTPNPPPPQAQPEESKRPYGLGKRLEQMDQSRLAILQAARAQLEAHGYRQLTMGSLAAATGLTRQTIHNLFGTKSAILEALFDHIAIDGGLASMREVMTQPTPHAKLTCFLQIFCRFWSSHRILIRRIHGIGAIDPDFGAVLATRNQRRLTLATRIAHELSPRNTPESVLTRNAASLAALTSFEFYDSLADNLPPTADPSAALLELAQKLFPPTSA